MALLDVVGQTVTGLGYELVEVTRTAGGLLRVTIDLPWTPSSAALANAMQLVTVEDCEKVTRQLQFALEVEAIDYKRLEVSSPGIDRPLRGLRDFERFAGSEVDLTLKAPMGLAAQGMVSASRKKFRGTLGRAALDGAGGDWQIVWSDVEPVKPGQRIGRKRVRPPQQVLRFALDEVREARLAAIVNFKGRGDASGAAVKPPGAD